ncbi:uncharacterized protein [Rutidosis leptorrhynchoides]|uniref:uncharacterized protein isoform X2 n=1 Tax=Rutidosis leptorrhynchoides TaxID=125765 RepID=UPI003A9958C8
MGDPYWRYADTASASRPSYTSYLSSDVPTLSRNYLSSSSDYLHKDILTSRSGPYGVDDITGIGVRNDTVLGGYTAGTSGNGYRSSFEDPYLLGRRDVMRDMGAGVRDIVDERPDSLRKANGVSPGSQKSNVLFVDALPPDCTRREVSHLFRPFVGFKEIRLVHKEPRNIGDKTIVLCFVEFSDSNHALSALEALQGYKFDNKKPDSAALQIHFAHFPFKLPPDKEELGFAHFQSQPQRVNEEQDLAANQQSLQLPPNRDERGLLGRYPSQQPSHKDERDRAIPREREMAVEDEEPQSVKRKFEGSNGSLKKKGKVEGSGSKSKKSCAKCKRKHSGECFVKSGACFRCGKTDHVLKDCPVKESVKSCYVCGEEGHVRAQCPKKTGAPKPNKKDKAS